MKLVTEKQKKLMRNLGLVYDSGMTAGEAEQIITEEMEMRAEAEDHEYNPFLDADDVPLFDRSTGNWDY